MVRWPNTGKDSSQELKTHLNLFTVTISAEIGKDIGISWTLLWPLAIKSEKLRFKMCIYLIKILMHKTIIMIMHWKYQSLHAKPSISETFYCKPSVAETGIFSENWVNTTAVDNLAPCVTRPSAAMVRLSSLAPGKFEWNFRHVIFKQILVITKLPWYEWHWTSLMICQH